MTIAGSGFKAAITLRKEIPAAIQLQKHAIGFLVRTQLKNATQTNRNFWDSQLYG